MRPGTHPSTRTAAARDAWEAAFSEPSPPTIGIEEEVMLLDPASFDAAPVAREVAERLPGSKLELPAAQLELVSPPSRTVAEAIASLAGQRRALRAAADGVALPAVAAVHPFASATCELNRSERYDRLAREYAYAAPRQLVSGLHVHVAVRPLDRAVAVHDALRAVLPELAALAANGPFHDGVDTGLASVRPKLAELLPRQGIPPVLGSVDGLLDELAWGAASGRVPEPASWWWELRLHALHGTVEVRVCDAQTTLVEAGALAAVIHCVVADLAARHAAGEAMPTPPSWRVEESRWSAGRHGLDASFADPVTGTVEPVRERLARRLDALAATAERLGCAHELTDAHALLQAGCGAERQRAVFAEVGAVGLARWLTDRFVGRFAPGATEGATRSAAVPRG